MKYFFTLPLTIFILLCIFVAVVFSGCTVETSTVDLSRATQVAEPYGTLQGVTVKSKEQTTLPCVGCSDYYVTLSKNEQVVRLELPTEDMYDTLQEGTLVNIEYNSGYVITKLTFAGLE